MLAMDVWCFSKSTARIDLEKHQTRLHYWGISLCNFGESPLQFWVFLLYTKQSQLFRKFASLSYQWDVDKIDQTRYGWLASVENEQLLLRLKKLSKKDLELLTLLFVDGYRQIDVARLWHCSRSAVAQRFKKIKKFLNNT